MSNEEVKQNNYLSHQDRGGIEYQIGIRNKNIQEYDAFKVDATALARTVITKVL